jgi:endonuclease YncB( thermonuclease family)
MKSPLLTLLLCLTLVPTVARVVDGDTVVIQFTVPSHPTARTPSITYEVVRVLGVDTPEMEGPTLEAAKAAREFTVGWLAQGEVLLKTCRRDSFGRFLGRLTRGREDLADALIRAGHGVPR